MGGKLYARSSMVTAFSSDADGSDQRYRLGPDPLVVVCRPDTNNQKSPGMVPWWSVEAAAKR